MKYIDADKLINLVREWRNKQMGFAWDAVNEVLKIVNSLQQEQPDGLDEAAEKAVENQDTAERFLKSIGIMDENGNLSETYK